MTDKEAEHILKNCIADYVISEYCQSCGDRLICDDRNEDCYFQQAIDTILDLYNKVKEENKLMKAEFNRLEDLEDNTEQLKILLKEEKAKNKELKDNYDKLSQHFIENHISKHKIKEKIKVLEMEIRYDFIDNTKAIKVLKELLEG